MSDLFISMHTQIVSTRIVSKILCFLFCVKWLHCHACMLVICVPEWVVGTATTVGCSFHPHSIDIHNIRYKSQNCLNDKIQRR